MLKKLVTKEDPLFLHKILGLSALLSFIYRYGYVFPTTGTLGMDGTWFDHATMAIHMLLSTSSLIFAVLQTRILSKPTIIWEEYRLHAISFTTRCVLVYAFGLFWPLEDSWVTRVALYCTVLSMHVVADMITERYGPEDKT